MCRHVVRAFIIVFVIGIFLWDNLIEVHFKVGSYRWVGIFIDGKRGGCMLYEDLANTCLYFLYLGHCL